MLRLLKTRVAWGMTVGQWLAALAVSPSGAFGWAWIGWGRPWTGALLLAVAQFGYYLLMAHDLDDVDNHRE